MENNMYMPHVVKFSGGRSSGMMLMQLYIQPLMNLLGRIKILNGLFSNCVYCPLKWKAKLLQIATAELTNGKKYSGTPASIDWWITMEKNIVGT